MASTVYTVCQIYHDCLVKVEPVGCRRDGRIETITVIHLIQLVLRFEIAQLGIGQHQGGLLIYRNTMIENQAKKSINIQ